MTKLGDLIKEASHKKILVDTSQLASHAKNTISGALNSLSAKSGTVFMESKVRVEGCKEDCPVTMEFEYKKTIKTRMEVEIRGRKLIVRIRDD